MISSRSGSVASANVSTEDHGVNVRRLPSTRLGSTSLARRLIDWLSFYILAIFRVASLPRQDMIICLTTPPFIAIAGIFHKLLHPKTRLVLWNMDSYPEALERTGMIKPGGLIAAIMRMINRIIFRRIDQLVCLISAMRDLLISQYAPKRHPAPGCNHSQLGAGRTGQRCRRRAGWNRSRGGETKRPIRCPLFWQCGIWPFIRDDARCRGEVAE